MADALPFPFDAEILSVVDLLQNKQAFNTECVDHATSFQSALGGLGTLITGLNLPELAETGFQISQYAANEGTDLVNHLTQQFEDLPTNLGLVQGYIDDMSAIQRLPGYNDATATRSAAAFSSGGYAFLNSVSPRAMFAPSLSPVYMAAGALGGVASALGGGMCGSMGNAFGSIMGKANQLMGQAMGALGKIQGLMGSVMGGGALNMISQFGNVAGLGSIPGIGNIGSLVSGIGNIGNLGQMGSLVSNIGQLGNVGALGSGLTSLFGGSGNVLGNLTSLGGIITAISGATAQAQSIGGVPLLSSQSPYAVQTQLNLAATQLQTVDLTELIRSIRACGVALATLLSTSITPLPSGATASTGLVGNVDLLVSQLYGLADYITANGVTTVGDITPTITLITTFIGSIQTYVPVSVDQIDLITKLTSCRDNLTAINNMQTLTNQLGTMSSTLGDYGGLTGFGNVAQTIGIGTSILSKLGSLGSVPGLGGLGSITSLIPNMQGLMGSFGGLLNGNIAGAIGGLGGLTGQLSGLLGGAGLGNITSMLGKLPGLSGITGQLGSLMGAGGLGGAMGGIGSMISGEKGMLGNATNALKFIAGSFNLQKLKNNGCAGSVLGNVGSDALKGAQGGSAGGTGSSDLSGSAPATGDDLTLGGKDDVFGGPNAPLYEDNKTQTDSSKTDSFVNTDGGNLSLGGKDDAFSNGSFDTKTTGAPAISGGDDTPPTAAQIKELNQASAPPPISGGDDTPPTSAQIDALNSAPTTSAARTLTPVDPQDLPTTGNGTNPYAGSASAVTAAALNNPTAATPAAPKNYDLSLGGSDDAFANRYDTGNSLNEGYSTTPPPTVNTAPVQQPTASSVSDGGADMRVRSTYYYAGETNSDPDTDAGRTSTGPTVRAATANQVGVAAVDPAIIPYGSQITVQTPDGPRYYIAADTGGAVKSQKASNGTAPVVDFYSTSQVAGTYTNVTVQPYTGSTPYTRLSSSAKESFFDINRFKK